jgi:hypothetical protein
MANVGIGAAPRREWKKIALAIAVGVGVIFAFLTWYKVHHSMDPARSFEVNSPQSKPQVLMMAIINSALPKATLTREGRSC